MAIAVLFAVSLAFEANHFRYASQRDSFPGGYRHCGCRCGIGVGYAQAGGKVMPVATFVCVFMGVCIARWAFYSASVV